MQHLKEDIQKKEFHNTYLLYGEEEYLVHFYRDKLKETILDGADEMNYSYFQGGSIDLLEVKEIAQTLPFFQEHRLIVMEDSKLCKNANDFADVIENVPDSTIFVFVEKEVNKRTKLYKYIQKNGIAVELNAMSDQETSIDKAQIDICCGGSQKPLSAPPGLTMVSVNETARKAMHERKTPIASFYANLLTFETYYEDMHFPYTQPISDIYGLRATLEDVDHDTNRFFRHKVIAKAVRQTLSEAGLKLYLEDGYASTVTAFYVPDGLTDKQIMDEMLEKYHIIISGSLGDLKGKLMRIGHMGNNANITDVKNTLSALTQVLEAHDISVKEDMGEAFVRCIKEME